MLPPQKISIYPNPFGDRLNVFVQGHFSRDTRIVFYNAAGQPKKVHELNGEANSIILNGLPRGIYFYEIWKGDVQLDSGKLVKVE